MATAICEQVSSDPVPRANWFVSGPAIIAYIACLEFPIHLPNPGGYGFFIDELYFMACGQHLSWGYVDMPPLTAVQAWAAGADLADAKKLGLSRGGRNVTPVVRFCLSDT